MGILEGFGDELGTTLLIFAKGKPAESRHNHDRILRSVRHYKTNSGNPPG